MVSAAASDQVRVFTHGEGTFASRLKDGSFEGQGADLLRCSMRALNQPFVLNQATMARKPRLTNSGALDAWFPSLVFGPSERVNRIAYPIGSMPIYWYVLKGNEVDTSSEEFVRTAKVSAFPGSTPESILRSSGYHIQTGTDDENIVVLKLIDGQLDGFLSASFEDILKPRTKALLVSRIERILYKNFDAGIEFTENFVRKNPGFLPRFQHALNTCAE